MFRRLQHTLPKDPAFEPDLEKLGFFITSEDLVRSTRDPEKKFNYQVNKNERYNEVHKSQFALNIQVIDYD